MLNHAKLNAYYIMAVTSLVFALAGFSYNAWRLEISEDNANIRTASFQVLIELSKLEKIIYAAHYDKDDVAGNPRNGWITVGLITDLSVLIATSVELKTDTLKSTWSEQWEQIITDKKAVDTLVDQIDNTRSEIKQVLRGLQ